MDNRNRKKAKGRITEDLTAPGTYTADYSHETQTDLVDVAVDTDTDADLSMDAQTDVSGELSTETDAAPPLRLSTPRKYSPVDQADNNIEELVTPVSTVSTISVPDRERTGLSSLSLTKPTASELVGDSVEADVELEVDEDRQIEPSLRSEAPVELKIAGNVDSDVDTISDMDVSARIEKIQPNVSPGVLTRGVNAYAEWRSELRDSIESFRDWLREQKICDAQTEERLDATLTAIADDKLHAAFVAEFSRGKSELINAIFFGGMDRRVLPSSAGRTTMCPTELLYDPDQPVGIRLLDIKTRRTDKTIAEYRQDPDAWQFHSFDPDNAEAVRKVLDVVTETDRVSFETSVEMALSTMPQSQNEQESEHQSEHQSENESGPSPERAFASLSSAAPIASTTSTTGSDALALNGTSINGASKPKIPSDGMVEIPRWRHAIINYPHPLLEQGLVVLDTPGLNALGVEPELTLNMLAQAHAVVFILAADAGVTASDLAVWENHIRVRERASEKGKLVALNKIDFLWDELLSNEEIDAEQQRMVRETAGRLAIPSTSIFPISAQKALVGKIRDDDELIQKSRIREFEFALANMLVPAKSDIVRDNVRGQLEGVSAGINAIIGQRLQDVDDHMGELDQLNSKNMQVIEDMMEKVRTDKDSLEGNLHRFQSTRQLFTQHSSELYNRLSLAKLEQCIMETKRDMELSLTTPGLRSRIVRFFQQTENMLAEASAGAGDIQEMMDEVYESFQQENGLTNVQPRTFDIERYQRELEELQENQNHFVNGLGVVFIEQKRLVRKFFDSVVFEVRQIFERCTRDADTWLKTIMSPMESQVREHQIQLRRRLESIKRIHQASDTLEDRVAEIEQFRAAITEQQLSMKKHRDALEKILSRQLTEALLHDTAA